MRQTLFFSNLYKPINIYISLWEKRKEPLFGCFSVNENRFKVINIKKGLKTLLPTLKEKKRYLVFEIVSKSPIKDYKDVSEQILAKSQEFLGILGMAKAGIQVMPKYNSNTQRGLIKVNHKHVDELKAALTFIDKLDNKEVIVNSIGVSGILKKAEAKYLKEV